MRYTARSFRTAPSFVVLVVLTLALGVSANGAVYSLLDRLILGTPSGISNGALVKRIHQTFRSPYSSDRLTRDAFSYREWEDLDRALAPGQIAALVDAPASIGDADAQQQRIGFVLGDYFGVLGVRPALGRPLHAEETQLGIPVAVISHNMWKSRFGSAADLQGQLLVVGGTQFRIVGVTPAGFHGTGVNAVHAWVSFNAPGNPADRPGTRRNVRDLRLSLIVRSSSRRELATIEGKVDQVLRALNATLDPAASVKLAGIGERMDAGRVAMALPATAALIGATMAILLMASVNAAMLILMRATRRRKETAIRFALGISRRRLLMQIAVEALFITAMVVAVALLATFWSGSVLRQRLVPDVDWGSSPVNVRVSIVLVVVGVAAGVAAAAAPAWLALRNHVWEGLRGGSRSGRTGNRVRDSLLGLQAALAVLLLTGGAIFLQSLRNVTAMPTGYDAGEVMVASSPAALTFGNADNGTSERVLALQQALSAHPGVEAAAVTLSMPVLAVNFAAMFRPNGDSLPSSPTGPPTITVASPEFHHVLGIKVIRGRALTALDASGNQPVILVSRFAARTLWPGQDAVGQCLIVFRKQSPCRYVVGVVDDISSLKIFEPPSIRIFVPLAQVSPPYDNPTVVLVRTRPGFHREVLATLQGAVARGENRSTGWRIDRFGDLFRHELQPFRTRATLFSVLAILGVTLAAIGMYGSVSQVVSELTPAIGIRRTLGADAFHVGRLLVRRAVTPVFMGASAGFVISVSLAAWQTTSLYNTSSAHPGVIASVAAMLLLVTLIACALPFRRALRVSPRTVLAAD
ncbi:MAG TPA: ABC transporter permease [Gemmatimonadaceae bacterium]|nr:ABC transporter permease [Gemmatimonadaceae bacterium]